MTIAYIDVAKAPVQVPVIDLLQEPQGAAFDFISGQAWIVDKVNPGNTMLRNIGDVLTNPGASATKLLRRKSGLIEAAPWWANEYDLAGNPMGMRVEAQRPNLLPQSSNLLGTDWQKSRVTVEPQAGIAPNGLNEAVKVIPSIELASATYFSSIAFSVAGADTAVYACSVYAKAAEYPICRIQSTGASAVNTVWDFDLRTGVFIAKRVQSTPAADVGVNIVPVGDGWYRITVFMTGNASRTHRFGFLGIPEGLVTTASQGDGVSGALFWRPQIEQAPFSSSIIPTASGTVTRAADQPQISTGFLPYNPAAGTLILEGMSYDYDTGVGPSTLGFSRFSNPALYYASILRSDTGSRNSRLYGGTRNAGSPDLMEMPIELSFPVTNPKKVGFTWGQTGMALASGVSGSVIEAAMPNWSERTFNFLKFDTAAGIMWYRSAIYIPRKLTAAELLQRVRA